jgi:hypothetical protein
MIPRAMLVEAYATGGVSHARQFKGDDPDKRVNVYLSSLMMKVPDHVYVLG